MTAKKAPILPGPQKAQMVPGPQKAQMVPGPQKAPMASDRLDGAIDAVAAQLTHADHDPLLAERIIAALPARASGWSWMLPRVAVAFAVLIVGITTVLLTGDRHVDPVAAIVATGPQNRFTPYPSVMSASLRVNAAPAIAIRPAVMNAPDHERSLAPLEVDGLLVVEPLRIDALPLTTESFVDRY